MDSNLDRAEPSEAGRLLALGSLVPGVVHELNNALLGLLGMLELAQSDATGAVAERLAIAQLAGDEIREIARVLGALAREPLDEAGPVDAREIAGEAVAAATSLNVVRGLELVEVYASTPVSVAVGGAQLRQALLLLLTAAFARSGRQGPLLLEVDADDGQGRLCVRHGGAGGTEPDPGLDHVAVWAAALGGELALERTRVTLRLPLAG